MDVHVRSGAAGARVAVVCLAPYDSILLRVSAHKLGSRSFEYTVLLTSPHGHPGARDTRNG